jgi:hypothetical protein
MYYARRKPNDAATATAAAGPAIAVVDDRLSLGLQPKMMMKSPQVAVPAAAPSPPTNVNAEERSAYGTETSAATSAAKTLPTTPTSDKSQLIAPEGDGVEMSIANILMLKMARKTGKPPSSMN